MTSPLAIYTEAAEEWEVSQRILSWHNKEHPAYKRIVALGEAAVPFILRDIQEEPDWIFLALRDILHDGPDYSDVAGQLGPMCERWLAWAKEKGIQW